MKRDVLTVVWQLRMRNDWLVTSSQLSLCSYTIYFSIECATFSYEVLAVQPFLQSLDKNLLQWNTLSLYICYHIYRIATDKCISVRNRCLRRLEMVMMLIDPFAAIFCVRKRG